MAPPSKPRQETVATATNIPNLRLKKEFPVPSLDGIWQGKGGAVGCLDLLGGSHYIPAPFQASFGLETSHRFPLVTLIAEWALDEKANAWPWTRTKVKATEFAMKWYTFLRGHSILKSCLRGHSIL